MIAGMQLRLILTAKEILFCGGPETMVVLFAIIIVELAWAIRLTAVLRAYIVTISQIHQPVPWRSKMAKDDDNWLSGSVKL